MQLNTSMEKATKPSFQTTSFNLQSMLQEKQEQEHEAKQEAIHYIFEGFVLPSYPWHLVHSQIVVEVDGGEGVHEGVVDELEVLALPQIVEILGEEDMEDGGEEHVDDHKDHERVEETGPEEEGEQLECQQASDDL